MQTWRAFFPEGLKGGQCGWRRGKGQLVTNTRLDCVEQSDPLRVTGLYSEENGRVSGAF